MNLFLLSWIVKNCAQWHFDRHVIKMILETAQLLSTAHHMLNKQRASIWVESKLIYRATHINHPIAKWCRSHVNNYHWLVRMGLALCREYSHRYYGRIHKTQAVMIFLRDHVPPGLPDFLIERDPKHNPHGFSLPIPQTMPPQYRRREVVAKCSACGDEARALERARSQTTQGCVEYECAKCLAHQQTHVPIENVRDAVQAYRDFYQGPEKRALVKWTDREAPPWFKCTKPTELLHE